MTRLAVSRLEAAGAALCGVGLAAGAYFASREPRLTLLNDALQFDHPWHRGAGALAAAGGAALLMVLIRRAWARVAFGLAAAAALWLSLHLFRYRVVSGRDALVVRDVLGETSLPWSEVTLVDRGPALLVVRSKDAVIRLGTGRFRPEDRAALERNVARHVTPPSP